MTAKSKWTQQRDEYFQTKFKLYFAKWKEQNPKKNTQSEFARQICEIREKKYDEKCPVTNSYVSEWNRGIWFPELYLPEIAEVLGVKEEDFMFQSVDDLYKKSSEYMTKLGHTETVPYCEKIGLDLHFLLAVRRLMGETFDKTFPIWSPIRKTLDLITLSGFKRTTQDLSTSADMDDGLNIFQCRIHDTDDLEPEGRLVTMGRADMDFLRDIQDEVKDYIQYLFFKRSKEQDQEVEQAKNRLIVPLSNGGYSITTNSVKIAKELNQIDKYFHGYMGNKPVREATQEDFDKFTNGGDVVTDKNGVNVTIQGGEK